MIHSKRSWSYVSIQRKVMTWVIAILLLVAISTSVSIVALEWMIHDYESLSIDNYKCYEVHWE